MPTIKQLPVAVAVSAADELPISQNGVTRGVTIGTLLGGTQTALTLASGALVGRVSAGAGGPEAVGLGAGLAMQGTALSATGADHTGFAAATDLLAGDEVIVNSGAMPRRLPATKLRELFSAGTGVTIDPTGVISAAAAAASVGPAGPQGPQGVQGPVGPAGPTTAATAALIGAVKPGSGLIVAGDGTLSVSFGTTGGTVATGNAISAALPLAGVTQLYGGTGTAGAAQPLTLGTNLSVTSGVINAVGGGAYAGTAPVVVSGTSIGVTVGTAANTLAAGNDARITGAEQAANKGAANGYAGLDPTGKVPMAQLPAAVQGALNYQGAWNASTNSPALASGAGTKGYYYTVSTAGTTALDGIATWAAGDHAVYNGTAWEKLDGIASEVLTVAGRTGNVVLTVADVSGALPAAAIPAGSGQLLGGSGAAGTAAAVTVGAGLSLSGGALSATYSYALPQATTTTLGGITAGAGLTVTGGVVAVAYGVAAGTAAAGNDSRITGALAAAAAAATYAPLTNAAFTGTHSLPSGTVVTGTGALILPQGTTSQQPDSGSAGEVRYNTTAGRYEFGTGAAWINHARLSGETLTGQHVLAPRIITVSGIVAVLPGDRLVKINKITGSPTAVTLEASPIAGTQHVIKDGKGDAATNAITITPASGTIDGAATFVINQNRAAVTLEYDGTEWSVI